MRNSGARQPEFKSHPGVFKRIIMKEASPIRVPCIAIESAGFPDQIRVDFCFGVSEQGFEFPKETKGGEWDLAGRDLRQGDLWLKTARSAQ
jgi:hypothetical protein